MVDHLVTGSKNTRNKLYFWKEVQDQGVRGISGPQSRWDGAEQQLQHRQTSPPSRWYLSSFIASQVLLYSQRKHAFCRSSFEMNLAGVLSLGGGVRSRTAVLGALGNLGC